MDCCFSFS